MKLEGGSKLVLLVLAATILAASPGAMAADSCSLNGLFKGSAIIETPPGQSLVGTFTFFPPPDCTLSGTVDFSGTFMPPGSVTAFPFAFAGIPYLVAADGTLTIDVAPGITFTGPIGLLANGQANGFVFMASPSLFRVAGTAVKESGAGLGVAGPTGPSGPSGPQGDPGTNFYAVHPGQRVIEVLADAGADTVTTVGRTPAASITGINAVTSNGDDADGPWVLLEGGQAIMSDGTYKGVQRDWSPALYGRIKTASSIATVRFWVGLFSADPSLSAAPAAAHLAGFRFDTDAGDSTWQFCTSNNGAQSCTDTTVAVAVNTPYSLWVTCDSGQCLGYVDGVVRATNTANLPALTQPVGYQASVVSLSPIGQPRRLRFGRFIILHN